MNALYQMWAIARVEYRMQWRQRGMIVIALAMLLIMVTTIVLMASEFNTDREFRDKFATASTDAITSLTFILAVTSVCVLLPFVLVNLIPRDRQIGVIEILHSTPMSSTTYLTGKLIAGWVTALSGLVPGAIVMAVLWYIIIAPFNILSYLEIWLVGALPLMVINVGLVIVLAFRMPDSRMAVAVAVGVIVLPWFIIGFDPRNDWLDIFNSFRPGVFFHYTDVSAIDDEIGALSPTITILSGLAQLALAWLGAVAWLRWRNGY
ncbi:MAG: hypothetical protein H6673_04460 [Anaerolineales bacterium]|nr:hypothetical protein [Anaerolineales bacterium]